MVLLNLPIVKNPPTLSLWYYLPFPNFIWVPRISTSECESQTEEGEGERILTHLSKKTGEVDFLQLWKHSAFHSKEEMRFRCRADRHHLRCCPFAQANNKDLMVLSLLPARLLFTRRHCFKDRHLRKQCQAWEGHGWRPKALVRAPLISTSEISKKGISMQRSF